MSFKHSLPYYYWRSVNNRESYENYDLFMSRVNKNIDKYNWLMEQFDVPAKLLINESIMSHKKSYPESWVINLRVFLYDKVSTRATLVYEKQVRKLDFDKSFNYELTEEERVLKPHPCNTYKKYYKTVFKGKLRTRQKTVTRRSPNRPAFNSNYKLCRYERLPIFEAAEVLKEYSSYIKELIQALGTEVLPIIGNAYQESVSITPVIGITQTNDKTNPWAIFTRINGMARKISSYKTASAALLGLTVLTHALYRKSHGDIHPLLE